MRSLLGTLAALVVLATGCGGGSDAAAEKPTPAPTPKVMSQIAKWRSNAESQSGFLMRDLGKVKPSLDDGGSVDDAMNVCLDLSQKKTPNEVARNASARFEVSTAKAKRIVALSVKYLCPEQA